MTNTIMSFIDEAPADQADQPPPPPEPPSSVIFQYDDYDRILMALDNSERPNFM